MGFNEALKFPFERFNEATIIKVDISFNFIFKFFDRREVTMFDYMPLQFGEPIFNWI